MTTFLHILIIVIPIKTNSNYKIQNFTNSFNPYYHDMKGTRRFCMADPVFIDIPEGVWTLVAENVVTGLLWKQKNRNTRMIQVFRDTGGAAPTLQSEGVEAFTDGDNKPEIISSSRRIDVYLWSIGGASRVRADL